MNLKWESPFWKYSYVQTHSATKVLSYSPNSSLVEFFNWSFCNHGGTNMSEWGIEWPHQIHICDHFLCPTSPLEFKLASYSVDSLSVFLPSKNSTKSKQFRIKNWTLTNCKRLVSLVQWFQCVLPTSSTQGHLVTFLSQGHFAFMYPSLH